MAILRRRKKAAEQEASEAAAAEADAETPAGEPEADAAAEPAVEPAAGEAEVPAAEPENAAAKPGGEAPADVGELTVDEVRSWQGFRLDEIGGAPVGKVEGVYVDEASGKPEWLLARMGRFGHHCLVPAREAVAVAEHVWVPYSRDQIRRAPRIEANTPLRRGVERSLLEHYGIATADAGRGAELSDGDGDAVTARPA